METNLFTTLAEARNFIEKNKYEGVNCPCCQQFYKVWRKKPISTALASLVRLSSLYRFMPKYYHLDEFNVVSKDRNFSQLVLWGLVEPLKESVDKRASGYWRPTDTGLKFVNQIVTIPKYVYSLNNKVIGFSEEQFSILDGLANKFSYSQLLRDNFQK